jgi:1-acyl-sn-glycerol-3-phosphate acyltransferase
VLIFRILHTIIAVPLILLAAALGIGISLLFFFLPLRKRWMIQQPIYQAWGMITCLLLALRLKVIGKENIPKDLNRFHLAIANHSSFADIPPLCAVIGLPFLMKKEILNLPILGRGGQYFGSIAFDRSSPKARKEAKNKVVYRMKKEVSVVTFPEGTRSKTGDLRPKIHRGLLTIAYDEGISVLPIHIHNTFNLFDRNHKIPWLDGFRTLTITIHPVQTPDPNRFTDGENFADYCWDFIKKTNDEYKQQIND